MRKISTVLLFLSFIILFGSTNTIALEVVTLQYPPYEFLEDGEVQGVAVEIVQEVFKRMKVPIKITLYPWDQSLAMIQGGGS